MKTILFIIISLFCFVKALTVFECLAPPIKFGTWCKSPLGYMGKTTVKIEYEALGDTQVFCEMNCCGTILNATIEYQECEWDCAGTPAIRCYGTPFGSAVRAYQTP